MRTVNFVFFLLLPACSSTIGTQSVTIPDGAADTSSCDVYIDSSPAHLDTPDKTYCLGSLTGAATFDITADRVTLDGQNKDVVLNADIDLTDRTGVVIKNIKISGGFAVTRGGANTILHSEGAGVFVCLSSDNKISGNVITDTGGGGYSPVKIEAGTDCSGSTDPTANNKLQGNRATGKGNPAYRFLYMGGTQNSRILDNLFEIGGDSGTAGNVAQIYHSDHDLFQGNYFSAVYPATLPAGADEDFGIHYRDGGSYSRFIRNEFHSNGAYAFILNAPGGGPPWGHDNLLQSNRIVLYADPKNGSALRFMTSLGNDQIENNLIYSESMSADASPTFDNTGLFSRFTNNTIYVKGGTAFNAGSSGTYATHILRNNLFYAAGGSALSAVANWTFDASNNVYQSESAPNPIDYSGSSDLGRVNFVPTFLNIDPLKFALDPTSPTIGKGIVVPGTHVAGTVAGVFDDQDLLPYSGSSPDIGAGDVQMPTRPENVTATVSGTGVGISWSPSADNVGVSGYEVYALNKDGPVLVGSVSGGTTSLAVTGLTPASRYLFFVRAADAAGNRSLWSEIVAVQSD